ncbi:polysaccharide deacetylase family protein [bacterium M00.F.Ca.ET.228.01.1.1]|uniref:polysaccharide deacetylase family protein n=1 Tax=Paraburkholderia phenoliruptrix TaxID=252970 RepID=UPI0010932DB3|nr:polysaccharide deacetylase family protein [Paraburkholderia phenoliruptrix]TGP40119.1 polysaccharide deacetylase family protein [bacterium M00.F.Ca.ET.228.01.1.1]TGR96094.1 polysaccharide deacetylase family protein [bacterium M00.F.Ca.ET.191.01.1.1]TGT97231.1 polysaccharide deacetylase family protein [bacterium M00.F.Ca.ET.155.01.1.1]MBW0450727.1 polysaccharide deacetylase family protein [Paraburkholderia phenoliruptrix]MBW9101792.1 polysaccharide deacetylase family protein [Paraburkholderi
MNSPSTPDHARPAPLRRWPQTGYPAMLTATAAWHVLVLGAWLAAPRAWPWWLAAIFANHAVFTVAGLLPRTSLLGPNWTRLPAGSRNADAIALTIDDGPDPVVTPQVLDLLDALGVRATFFCIGEKARRYPHLVREIVARGHALENHSQVHVHTFSVTLPHALWREIDAAQRTFEELSGERPMFFRAPAGLRNIFLEPVLRKLDLRLAAWTRRGYDTRERDPEVVARRLLDGLAARDILLLHDGNAALTADGKPLILAVLPRIVEAARRHKLRFVTLREARVDA